MSKKLVLRSSGALLVTMLAACGSSQTTPTVAPPALPGPITVEPQEKPMIPAGLGTLRQDEFTVGLRSGALQVKVTPLAETVIRTAAPDTYNRLHALSTSRRAEALRAAAPSTEVELFLVSFFSNEQNTTFQPENLQITHQGRQMRAATVIPLTPGWGRQQLAQQQQQSAIYAFVGGFDFELPLTVRYGQEQSEDWSRILANLQVERQKVLSRVK